MPTLYSVDTWPSWSIYLVLVLAFILFSDLGCRLGRYRHHLMDTAEFNPSSEMVEIVFGLLAFLWPSLLDRLHPILAS